MLRSTDSGYLPETVQFQTGISVQFAPESLSSFNRIQCPVCSGIGVQFGPEYSLGTLVFVGTPLVAEAGEMAMKGRYVNLKTETDCTEVGDVDGHVICSFVLPSAGILDDGEVYSRVVRGTFDLIKGVGVNQGHTINTYADGSVTTVEWEGTS